MPWINREMQLIHRFIVSASRSPPGLDWILYDCSLLEDLFEFIVCVFPMVWALFSSIVFGCEKNPLLEVCFTLGAFFGAIFSSSLAYLSIILAHFSFLGALWERWGPTCSSHKRFGPPKVRQEEFSPKNLSLLWSHFWVSFCEFFCFLSYIFKHRFLLSSGTDFPWILASFQHNFLIFVCTCPHLWF